MTYIDVLTSEETAREEIRGIAELSDAVLTQPKYSLPKSLPQPDYLMDGKGRRVLYFIVTTRADCVNACQSFERIRKTISDPDYLSTLDIELYCRDAAVRQWVKNTVSTSTDES